MCRIVLARPHPFIVESMRKVISDIGGTPVLTERDEIPSNSRLIIVSTAPPNMEGGASGKYFWDVVRKVRETQSTPIVLTTLNSTTDWMAQYLKLWDAESRIVSTDANNDDMLWRPNTFVALRKEDLDPSSPRIDRTRAMLKRLAHLD